MAGEQPGGPVEAEIMAALRKKREERKLAREDVRELTGIRPESLRLMEAGQQRVRLGVYLALCDAYKIDPAELLGEEEES